MTGRSTPPQMPRPARAERRAGVPVAATLLFALAAHPAAGQEQEEERAEQTAGGASAVVLTVGTPPGGGPVTGHNVFVGAAAPGRGAGVTFRFFAETCGGPATPLHSPLPGLARLPTGRVGPVTVRCEATTQAGETLTGRATVRGPGPDGDACDPASRPGRTASGNWLMAVPVRFTVGGEDLGPGAAASGQSRFWTRDPARRPAAWVPGWAGDEAGGNGGDGGKDGDDGGGWRPDPPAVGPDPRAQAPDGVGVTVYRLVTDARVAAARPGAVLDEELRQVRLRLTGVCGEDVAFLSHRYHLRFVRTAGDGDPATGDFRAEVVGRLPPDAGRVLTDPDHVAAEPGVGLAAGGTVAVTDGAVADPAVTVDAGQTTTVHLNPGVRAAAPLPDAAWAGLAVANPARATALRADAAPDGGGPRPVARRWRLTVTAAGPLPAPGGGPAAATAWRVLVHPAAVVEVGGAFAVYRVPLVPPPGHAAGSPAAPPAPDPAGTASEVWVYTPAAGTGETANDDEPAGDPPGGAWRQERAADPGEIVER